MSANTRVDQATSVASMGRVCHYCDGDGWPYCQSKTKDPGGCGGFGWLYALEGVREPCRDGHAYIVSQTEEQTVTGNQQCSEVGCLGWVASTDLVVILDCFDQLGYDVRLSTHLGLCQVTPYAKGDINAWGDGGEGDTWLGAAYGALESLLTAQGFQQHPSLVEATPDNEAEP